jgi:hypothetical protein
MVGVLKVHRAPTTSLKMCINLMPKSWMRVRGIPTMEHGITILLSVSF